MIRRWWRRLGFFWQIYLFMVASFVGIIMFVEGIIEPLWMGVLMRWTNNAVLAETLLWLSSVLLPTLLLGYLITRMVMHRLGKTVKMAKRLSYGDLGARIDTAGDDGDAFDQLADAFNAMADSLQRLLSHEKRLLADISHELRSPLTRMGLATALLPMKRETADFEATVKTVDAEIEHMNTLVGFLLEQGRDRLRNHDSCVDVDLTELAAETADAFLLLAADGDKRIDTNLQPGVTVWGHHVRIRMTLENILSNALRHAPAHSAVDIIVARQGGEAILTVRDRGPGVPEQHLEEIFTAFFRVDKSRARTSGGVGLGLTLAKDAVVAMGGEIHAANAEPGLEVTVRLPCLAPAADRPLAPTARR